VSDDSDAEELLKAQREKELVEHDAAEASSEEDEAMQHERRSEKARYLSEKLQERVESEKPTEDH
jgi:hypothetical protein